jgi:hypothetical protein
MKRILLILTLGAVLTCPSHAQPADSGNPPPPPPDSNGPPPGGGHFDKILTPAEKAELKKAHDAAIAADPTLGTEEQDLHSQMKAAREAGGPPSDDLKAQMKAFHEKMDEAMSKADPAVIPILAKLKAAHHHHDGGDGPPPPPPSA